MLLRHLKEMFSDIIQSKSGVLNVALFTQSRGKAGPEDRKIFRNVKCKFRNVKCKFKTPLQTYYAGWFYANLKQAKVI